MQASSEENSAHKDDHEVILEWREDMIERQYGQIYDQQNYAEESGTKDERTGCGFLYHEGQPYRHINNWYIVQTEPSKVPSYAANPLPEKPTRRHPLPDGHKFSRLEQLHGILEPNNLNDKSIHVLIPRLNVWALDCSADSRGFWIESSNAWYKLKSPCTERIPLTVKVSDESDSLPAILPSQADLHLPLRARLGLISNITDLLLEENEEDPDHYIKVHTKNKPSESYELLSITQEYIQEQQCESQTPLFLYPFDIELLKTCASFVRRHLKDLHPSLSSHCEFMKGLSKMEQQYKHSNDSTRWTNDRYRESAEQAEHRGSRNSYGDRIGSKEVTPNRKLEIDAKIKSGGGGKWELKSIKVIDVSQTFSSENHSNAQKALSPYITPENGIDQSKVQTFIPDVLDAPTVPSLEYMLICIKELKCSSKKVLKALFKKEGEGGRGVFVHWFNFVFSIMTGRRNGKSAAQFTGEETEEMVITEILHLICDFNVIKEAKQLEVLKSKFGVDWMGIVKKTLDFEKGKNIEHLAYAANRALQHLKNIATGNGVQSLTLQSSTRNMESNIPGKSTEYEKPENPDDDISKPMKIPPHESPESLKERLRRQRIAKMREKAQGMHKMDYSEHDIDRKPSDLSENMDRSTKYEHNSHRISEDEKHSAVDPNFTHNVINDASSKMTLSNGPEGRDRHNFGAWSAKDEFHRAQSSQTPNESVNSSWDRNADKTYKPVERSNMETKRENVPLSHDYASSNRGQRSPPEDKHTSRSWNNHGSYNTRSEDSSQPNSGNCNSWGKKNVDSRNTGKGWGQRHENTSSWGNSRGYGGEDARQVQTRPHSHTLSGRRRYEEDGEIEEDRSAKRRKGNNDVRDNHNSRPDQSTNEADKYNDLVWRDERNAPSVHKFDNYNDHNNARNNSPPRSPRSGPHWQQRNREYQRDDSRSRPSEQTRSRSGSYDGKDAIRTNERDNYWKDDRRYANRDSNNWDRSKSDERSNSKVNEWDSNTRDRYSSDKKDWDTNSGRTNTWSSSSSRHTQNDRGNNSRHHMQENNSTRQHALSKSPPNDPVIRPATNNLSSGPIAPLGRGRGRGKNLPAWMTSGKFAQDTNVTSVEESVEKKQEVSRPPVSSHSNIPPNNQYQTQPPTVARDIAAPIPTPMGRGRGKNLPAWMTSGQVSQDVIRKAVENAEENRRNSPPERIAAILPPMPSSQPQSGKGKGKKGNDDTAKPKPQNKNKNKKPKWVKNNNNNNNKGFNPNQNNSFSGARDTAPVPPPAGRGHGLGRGRNVNLPAWMTAKKD